MFGVLIPVSQLLNLSFTSFISFPLCVIFCEIFLSTLNSQILSILSHLCNFAFGFFNNCILNSVWFFFLFNFFEALQTRRKFKSKIKLFVNHLWPSCWADAPSATSTVCSVYLPQRLSSYMQRINHWNREINLVCYCHLTFRPYQFLQIVPIRVKRSFIAFSCDVFFFFSLKCFLSLSLTFIIRPLKITCQLFSGMSLNLSLSFFLQN